MGQAGQFQIDRTRIIFEQFDDETILVNSDTGYYFSLSNGGSDILRLLEDGWPLQDLPAYLFGELKNDERRRTTLDQFVVCMIDEGILIPRAADAPIPADAPSPAPYGPGIEFPVPSIERFDDVRDLLLIDPIHQVDPAYGWPKGVTAGSSLESGN